MIIKFDESMVAFGAPNLPVPARVSCNDAFVSAGQPRWIDDKTWAWDFAADLPPGVACSVDLDDRLKSSAGHALTGPRHFAFQTGGPFVQRVEPYGGEIEEDQAFVLRLNGPATQASVQQDVWCESSGLGNRIPVKNVDAATRTELLKRFRLQKEAARVLTLQC